MPGGLADGKLPPSVAALASLALLQVTWLCHRRAVRACSAMQDDNATGRETGGVARGGLLEGLRLLLRDRYLLAIGGYIALLGMVATAFAVAWTALVGQQIARGRDQHGWLARQELVAQSIVLLQVFCTGRLLRRFPSWVFLCLWPTLSILGLAVVGAWPTASAIAVVQIARRAGQFAFEKPAREVLYTPLDVTTKHKVKFMLDTVALRSGDVFGVIYQVALPAAMVFSGSCVLVALWAAFGFVLGRRSERAKPTLARP